MLKEFLREYWLWIAVPFLLVALGLAALWLLASDGGPTPFTYNVFS